MATTVPIDRGDFWEFKARTSALDLEAATLRVKLQAVGAQKNALVETFAMKHGLDATRPIVLDDELLSVSQEAS